MSRLWHLFLFCPGMKIKHSEILCRNKYSFMSTLSKMFGKYWNGLHHRCWFFFLLKMLTVRHFDLFWSWLSSRVVISAVVRMSLRGMSAQKPKICLCLLQTNQAASKLFGSGIQDQCHCDGTNSSTSVMTQSSWQDLWNNPTHGLCSSCTIGIVGLDGKEREGSQKKNGKRCGHKHEGALTLMPFSSQLKCAVRRVGECLKMEHWISIGNLGHLPCPQAH